MRTDFAECLTELKQRGLLPAERVAVMLIGSAARGWANSNSDYDLCVITETPWRRKGSGRRPVPLQPGFVTTELFQAGDRCWDVKYWLDGQVDQMLAKVSWAQFENLGASHVPLQPGEELFLERLVGCVPLENPEWVYRRRQMLEDTAFRAFLVTRSLADADGYIGDALGQLAAHDLPSAVLSARLALGHTVDALLDSHGQYGTQLAKWRARRLIDAQLPQLPFARYWELETMAGFRADKPEAWIEEVLTLCRQLSLEVEI